LHIFFPLGRDKGNCAVPDQIGHQVPDDKQTYTHKAIAYGIDQVGKADGGPSEKKIRVGKGNQDAADNRIFPETYAEAAFFELKTKPSIAFFNYPPVYTRRFPCGANRKRQAAFGKILSPGQGHWLTGDTPLLPLFFYLDRFSQQGSPHQRN
jgi:hypothetical protein